MRQSNQNLIVARLTDQPSLPTRVAEGIEKLRLFFFFDFVRVPGADKENEIVGDPIGALKVARVVHGLGDGSIQQQSLLADLIDIFQTELDDIGDNPPAAGFGNRAGREFVRSRVDMIDLDAGKAFLEDRINFFRVDLRQRAIAIENPFFFERFFV